MVVHGGCWSIAQHRATLSDGAAVAWFLPARFHLSCGEHSPTKRQHAQVEVANDIEGGRCCDCVLQRSTKNPIEPSDYLIDVCCLTVAAIGVAL